MSAIDNAASELREMDDLAALSSPIHRLHPITKLLWTVFYILTVVSFHRYDVSGLVTMVLLPALAFALSGIPVTTCFYKLRYVLPLVCAAGAFNPLFDRSILFTLGSVHFTGGFISMTTLILKGILCLSASFLLAATTSMDALCAALRRLHVPSMLVTLLLLTYRYVSLMVDEVSVMVTAYRLRAPGQRGVHYSAWGSFLGQLLLRSMDRAEEVYSGMQLRGFRGEFPYAEVPPLRVKDIVFTLSTLALLLLFRHLNVAGAIGALFI